MTVIISRIKDSKSPMTGGTDHISHRLLKKGYTDSQVLLIFVFFSLMILALTMGILYLNEIISSILLIIYFISVFISLIYFLRLETLN